MRVLKYALFAVLALLVLLVAAVAFVASTETGTRLAWQQARAFLPAGMTVKSLHGRLLGPLSVRDFNFRTEFFHVHLNAFELRMTPAQIFSKRMLKVDLVAVRGLRYTQLDTPPETKEPPGKFTLPERVELPLDVSLTVRVRDVRYKPAPEAEPFVVRSAALDARFLDDRLTVERLRVDAPLFDVSGDARLVATGDYPLEAAIDWRARPPEYAPVAGRTRMDGDLRKQLRIDQRLADPYRTHARVTLDQVLTNSRFNADLDLRDIRLPEIQKGLPPIALNAKLSARGAPDDLNVNARVRAREPRYGTLNLALAAGFTDKVLSIEELALSSPDQPASLDASGRVSLRRSQPDVDVKARWSQLRWPLTGAATVKSSRGELNVDGTMENVRARLNTALGGSALTAAGVKAEQGIDASFHGGFARQVLTVDQFQVKLKEQAARLNANGEVDLRGKQPDLAVDIDWRALRWPLAGKSMLTSPDGTVAVDGTPADLRARLDIGVGDDGRIEGQVRRAGEKIEAALDWRELRWPLQGEAAVTSGKGALDVNGTLEEVRAKMRAQLGGAALAATGIKQEQQLGVDFDGGFSDQVVNIDGLDVSFLEQQLNAAGQVALGGKQPDMDMNVNWRKLQWPLMGTPLMTSPRGNVAVKGTPENLRATADASVGKDGDIDARATRMGERIDVTLDWRELAFPLNAPRATSPAGRIAVKGLMSDYTLEADAQVDAPEYTDADISLAGNGSMAFLNLSRIDLRALQGQLTGNARVAWKPALQTTVALDADGLNPGELLADWPGRLGLSVRAAAEMRNEQLVAQVDRLQVDGRLRGRGVKLNAEGDYDAEGLALNAFSLVSGDSRLEAKGSIGDTLDMTWRVDSPDLGQLLPKAAGRLTGEGSASGPLERPRVIARLTGEALRYQTFQLQTLDLDADIDPSGTKQSKLALALKDGAAGDVVIRRIELDGQGDPADHKLALTARTSTGNADIELDGGLENAWQPDMLWRFRLEEATLRYPELAAWRLPAPVSGLLSAERAQLDRGCWESGAASLCLQGERTAEAMRAAFELEQLDFSYFERLLPPDTLLEGSVSGRGEVEQPTNSELEASAQIETSAGRVATMETDMERISDTRGEEQALTEALPSVNFRPSTIDLQLGSQGLQLAGALRLLKQGGIDIEAEVPDGDAAMTRRPLSGLITADMPDLSFIASLVPELEEFEGRLQGNMRLSGTLETPEIRGRLALLDSFAVLRGPGLTLKNIRVALIGRDGRGIQLDASMRSGGGRLGIDGLANLAADNGPEADINIRGQDFQVFNTVDARAFISPDIDVKVRGQRVHVTGEVRVPRANITPKELPESAVTVSGDQVIVRPGEDEGSAESSGPLANARVRLILGDDVNVEAFGLTGRFAGDLLIIEKPGEPTRGSGELSIVEGVYQAYGQDLIIETGNVLFPGGPISEPGLEVRAIRGDLEDQDIVVGVEVRGSLRRPDFTLFSDPTMPQQTQLSYLVLGRAPGESSGGESSLLARAALALGLKGGNFLAENFGNQLGVDEFGFESGETASGGEQASLVIGKYLSPKLYVSYGIGLLEPISTVRLQYSISSRWKLETQSSGVDSGGDLIYTIERGR